MIKQKKQKEFSQTAERQDMILLAEAVMPPTGEHQLPESVLMNDQIK